MRWTVLYLTLGLILPTGCDRGQPGDPDAGEAVTAAAFPGMSVGSEEAVQDSAPIVVRRVWYHPEGLDFWGGPSPDGDFLTFTNWTNWGEELEGALAVHDLGTGEDRPVTPAKWWKDSGNRPAPHFFAFRFYPSACEAGAAKSLLYCVDQGSGGWRSYC